MSECINALSDDIFALLFGHFSLSELFACRLICRRWNSAVHQICSLRESAKLFTSANDVLHYGEEVLLHQVKDRKTAASLGTDLEYWALKPPGRDDHLILNDCQLTPEFCQFFARLFPNVKHLIVYLNDDDDHHHQLLKNLPTLLQYYSVRLESLSLCGHVSRLQSSSTHHFLPFINSCLPQLKRLDLLTRNLSLLLFNNGLYSLAQVLSQLKHFSVNGKAVSNSDQCFPLSSTSNHRSGLHLDIAPVFEFLSESCTSLILKDVNFTAAHLADIYDALSTNPRLVTSVTHISLTGDLSLAVVKFICTNFRYLTKLQLEFASTETTILCSQILTEICHFKSLVELHLCNLTYILALLPLHHHFNQSHRLTPSPLHSLRTLTLVNCKVPTEKCAQFFSELVDYFPNIENFTVKTPSPADNLNCRIVEQSLRSFFTKLKSINLVDSAEAGSAVAEMFSKKRRFAEYDNEQMDTS